MTFEEATAKATAMLDGFDERWGETPSREELQELFKQAVEKIGSAGEITPDTIREAIKGQEMIAPQGKIRLEKENLHTWLWPKIAVAKSDGQFEVLKDSAEWQAPDPYAAYPNQKCTEAGLKEA